MNEQKNIESPLSGIPKKNPFEVPENYFETLQDKIEARIDAENLTLSKKQQVIRILKPVLSMAASFALVFLLVYYPLNRFLPDYLAKKEISNYNEAINTSEDDLIFSYLSISEHSIYEIFGDKEEQINNEVSEEEVLDYLTIAMNETEIFAELKN
ncbi:hypothetical protein ACUNWD_07945 [Sunxiuqinia sp. A32]|uniref:hypothetical protein n=1 Tax=Sunxiuqinia sp. A32 TaxID=3461496 RepID=UPI004045A728